MVLNYMNLSPLTGKKYSMVTSSGRRAIEVALQLAKEKGFTELYYPDQGGWKTYAESGEKAGFSLHELKTDLGIINFDDVQDSSVVIFHTMPAYAFNQQYDYAALKQRKIFVIADIGGDMGRIIPEGDLLLGSFGKWKVVSNEYGGFLASDEPLPEEKVDEAKLKDVSEKVENVEKRWSFLRAKRKEVIEDLSKFDILHKEDDSINVIVRFHNDEEKEKLITYCKEKDIPFKLCPFAIRVLTDAISIEIKRLK